MKEFWMILGLFLFVNRPKIFAFGVTDPPLRKDNSSVSINIYDSLETSGSSLLLNLTQWTSTAASLLQKSKGQSKTIAIIAWNNKVNEFSFSTVSETILPVLSTFFVAQRSTNELDNTALSTNVPPENLATKHSSLNFQNDYFSAKQHSTAISSKASLMSPDIPPTAAKFSGIILPSSSVDKKHLPISQGGVNSKRYISQGAFTKSALSDERSKGFISQSQGQFSSRSSILGQISNNYDGNRLFTKGSMSLTKLPKPFYLSSRSIWKTTQLNPRADETILLFSDKPDTSLLHAMKTSDNTPSTIATTRTFSSTSGMLHATLAAKMTQDKRDFVSTSFSASSVTQMVTSSVVHSQIQREISLVSAVVMASPSVSSKTRRISSRSTGVTTVLTTPLIHQHVTSILNSKLSSRSENEFHTLASIDFDKERVSSRTPFTSSKDSAANISASISLDQTTISVPQGILEMTPSLTAAGLKTHSLRSRTSKVNLKMSLADSAKNFVTRTSSNVKFSSENFSPPSTGSYHQTWIFGSIPVISGNEIRFSSTQNSGVTKELNSSSGSYSKSPTQIPHKSSVATASFNEPLMSRSITLETGHQLQISSQGSVASTDPVTPSSPYTKYTSHMISHSLMSQRRSSAESQDQNFPSFNATVTAPFDKSKLQTSSSSTSATQSRTELTSGVIVPLPEESATSYKVAGSTQSRATVNPAETKALSATVIASISTGSPTTTVADSSHKLLIVTDCVVHSTIQEEISLVSSIVMASPSVSSKVAKMSSQSFSAAMRISTTPIIQQPVTSGIFSKISSIHENELHQKSQIISSIALGSRESSSEYVTKNSVSISLNQTTVSLPKRMSTQVSLSTKMSHDEDDFASMTFPTSYATRMVTSSVENLSSPFLSSTKAKTMTKWLTKFTVQPTDGIPLSASEKFPALNTGSYHQTQISRSRSTQSSDMTSKLVASSTSYTKSSSQIPLKIRSAYTGVSSRSIRQKRSSAVSQDQNFSPSLSSTATTFPDKSKLQTSSSAVSATYSKSEITSEIIIPAPGESVAPYKTVASSIKLVTTVNPTQTRSSSATVTGNISTEPPTTAATDTGHIKLLIVVAIIPSIILCAFFAAVLLVRRSRKRRNKAVYSIKLEYADENNGFRKRCVNSRLDLSLKGIHIDLEFPNSSGDRERRGSYGRDSPRYSRGSNLSETQMRELQILSQECRDNMEWISEVIAREMEASICARIQPANRESVYSVKEKENYELSEKGIIRRESSKRGRETVKWRVPVVQRRVSEEFDQRDSMCTDDTTLSPDDWKDGQQSPKTSMTRNGAETQRKNNQKPNSPVKRNGEEANLDKELRVQLSNKKLDELQSQNNDKKENELAENKPLSVNLNSKQEDTSHATQGKRTSSRPRRFETL